jgi:dienelactone hydrolase
MKISNHFLILLLSLISLHAKSQNAEIERRADLIFNWLQNEKYDSVTTLFDRDMKRQFDASQLEGVWGQVTMTYGAVKKSGEVILEKQDKFIRTQRLVDFEGGRITLLVAFDSINQVAGLFLQPGDVPYSPSIYVNTESFNEYRIDFGAPDFKNSGKLSIPKSSKKAPLVIIVAGSGGIDKDCSMGANKIYKDLAWGLSSKGIATFRFDKRTYRYQNELVENDKSGKSAFDIRTEYLQDLKEIISSLKKRKDFDTKRIFIMGHSQGGYLIPLLNKEFKAVFGFISLAGTLREIPELALEQVDYLSSFETMDAKDSLEVQSIKRQMRNSLSQQISNVSSNDSVLGPYTVNYWKYLSSYKPAVLAAQIKKPVLVLQGERDYQVLMKDYELWKSTCSGKPNFSFKSYPALNHLFMEGSGGKLSTPKEYLRASNVPEFVIIDIKNWIESLK